FSYSTSIATGPSWIYSLSLPDALPILRSGDAVVVIATPNHLAGLEERLRQQGFDLFTLGLRDQYIPLDADETLSQFVVDDWPDPDRKSTRLNSSHVKSSYAVFCLKKKI